MRTSPSESNAILSVAKYVKKDCWIKIVHMADASVEQMPINDDAVAARIYFEA